MPCTFTQPLCRRHDVPVFWEPPAYPKVCNRAWASAGSLQLMIWLYSANRHICSRRQLQPQAWPLCDCVMLSRLQQLAALPDICVAEQCTLAGLQAVPVPVFSCRVEGSSFRQPMPGLGNTQAWSSGLSRQTHLTQTGLGCYTMRLLHAYSMLGGLRRSCSHARAGTGQVSSNLSLSSAQLCKEQANCICPLNCLLFLLLPH